MFSDPSSLSGSKYCPISYPWPHSGKCCIHPVDSGSCEKHEVYYEKELISAEKSLSCPECTKPPSNQYITLIVIAYNIISYFRHQLCEDRKIAYKCVYILVYSCCHDRLDDTDCEKPYTDCSYCKISIEVSTGKRVYLLYRGRLDSLESRYNCYNTVQVYSTFQL